MKENAHTAYQIKVVHDAILMPLEKYSKRGKPTEVDHCHIVQLMLFPRCTNDHILSHQTERKLWFKNKEKTRADDYNFYKAYHPMQHYDLHWHIYLLS